MSWFVFVPLQPRAVARSQFAVSPGNFGEHTRDYSQRVALPSVISGRLDRLCGDVLAFSSLNGRAPSRDWLFGTLSETQSEKRAHRALPADRGHSRGHADHACWGRLHCGQPAEVSRC